VNGDDCEGDFPGGWELPSVELLQQLGQIFDVPPELLGSLFQVIQTIDYDQQDALEDQVTLIIATNALFTQDHPAAIHLGLGKIPVFLAPGNLSPGLAQIQLRRAEQMEEWLFADSSTATSKYDPMRETLGIADSKADRMLRLLNPRASAAYAAAHTRWLMEQEFGPSVTASDLSREDMALIISQYNAAPRSDPIYGISDYRENRFGALAVDAHILSAWQIRVAR
jgi:hypothetical protein